MSDFEHRHNMTDRMPFNRTALNGVSAIRRCRSGLKKSVRKAFSLVEIIVVMLIIIIGTTVALYSYAGFRENLGLDTSLSLINQYLLQSKNLAINQAVPHQLVIDLESENIWINRLDDMGNIDASRVVENEKLPDEVEFDFVTLNGVQVASGLVEIEFDPGGTNPLIIIDIRKGGAAQTAENTARITLYPVSSQTKVEKGVLP